MRIGMARTTTAAAGVALAAVTGAALAGWAGRADPSRLAGAAGAACEDIPPSWDRALPASGRWRLVMDNEAVLDRETGLVWERSPGTSIVGWADASFYCYGRSTGGRKGWRLPAVEELSSLVAPGATGPALPAGHPFAGVQSDVYWSSTTIAGIAGSAYGVFLNDGTLFDQTKGTLSLAWCVRGGRGHDGK